MIKKCTKIFLVSIGLMCTPSYAWPIEMDQFNAYSLHQYDQLKHQYIKKTDPLIIAWGNKLTLIHQGQTTDYSIISEEYQILKSISHTALTVFTLFHPRNHFPKNKNDVELFNTMVQNIQKSIESSSLNPKQKQRQKKILHMTYQLLSTILQKKNFSQQQLNRYYENIQPLIQNNIQDAAKNELYLLTQRMKEIAQVLPINAKKNLFVVIVTSKMPREGNLLAQFFEKYLNTSMDSSRLIYAEGLSQLSEVESLVGTWQIDQDLSQTLFHNPNVMKKDLLGNATKQLLGTDKTIP